MTTLNCILDSGVVAVIRNSNTENILPIAEALAKGGVTALEITVETPKVLDIIEKLNERYGDKLTIGAGTVLDAETARAAIMSGATFIFSPVMKEETIRITKRYGKIAVAGAFTPTEILTAYEAGSDIIKVFPASVVGPNFFKDMKGPLPQIPLMPTGGVDLENVGAYIRSGAVAVGVGSTLVKVPEVIDEQYLSDLTEKASRYIDEVKKARLLG